MKLKALMVGGGMVVAILAGCGTAPKPPMMEQAKTIKTATPTKAMPTQPLCMWKAVAPGSTFTMNGMSVEVTLEEAMNAQGYCGQVRTMAVYHGMPGSFNYNTSVLFHAIPYGMTDGQTDLMTGMAEYVGKPYTVGKVCGLVGQAILQNAQGFTVTAQTDSLCIK